MIVVTYVVSTGRPAFSKVLSHSAFLRPCFRIVVQYTNDFPSNPSTYSNGVMDILSMFRDWMKRENSVDKTLGDRTAVMSVESKECVDKFSVHNCKRQRASGEKYHSV
jgi:hypothetical protein